MLVELGGGSNPHPRADVVIDLHHPKASPAQDATVTPWQVFCDPRTGQPVSHKGALSQLNDGKVDEIYCSHFMEHVPKGQPLIDMMNEAWRVLKPGGSLLMLLPLVGWTTPESGFGQMVPGWQPYADPTHVSFWWFPESLMYFTEGPFKPHADYGMRVWSALDAHVDEAFATEHIDAQYQRRCGSDPQSWWTVRHGFEGVARMVKPL